MREKLTDEILINLYNKNYTMKEIALLYDFNPCTIYRKIKRLIDIGELKQRPRIRKNRATVYGSDDKISINIRDNDNNKRIITDEDIMTLIGFGFKETRISLITGIPVEMIKDIVSKYSKYDNNNSNVNKCLIIELYNNRLNRLQIQSITGYSDKQISSVLNQAIRSGFVENNVKYITTAQEKTIMEMYRNYCSINHIAKANRMSTDKAKDIINNLLDLGLLEQRNSALRIINRKRLNDGIEDYNLLKLYNLCISEDIIADYYKVSKNTILKAVCKLNRKDIKLNDRIYELAVKEKISPRQISLKLGVPLDIIYKHLREVVR